MTHTAGTVRFAVDGSSLSPIQEAVAGGGPGTVEIALLSLLLAVVLVGVVGVLSYLSDATDRLDREIVEVEAERDAYLAFADAVDDIQVSTSTATMTGPSTVQAVEQATTSVAPVRSAFESTVMAVDHYDEQYDESWLQHLSAELDADLATTLRDRRAINRPIKQALHQRSLEAAAKRAELLDVLAPERRSLEDAERSVSDVLSRLDGLDDRPLRRKSFEELRRDHDALGEQAAVIEATAERRQRTIHRENRDRSWGTSDVMLQEYLYGGLDATFPALSVTTTVLDRIGIARRRVRRAMTARV
ncbi:MAG: hypothetical protein ABEJ55_06520 [Halanaeroarchaeum sp.]